jgi:hypothetical protein
MGYNCLFTNKGVTIFKRSDGSFAFKDVLRGKLYLMEFVPEEVKLDKCLVAKRNMGWLWHHRLAHVGMRNLNKLQKKVIVDVSYAAPQAHGIVNVALHWEYSPGIVFV